MLIGLRDRLENFATTMMQSPPGLAFDYSKPQGEVGLVTPDSISWRIFKNPVSLFIGGVAAVILEFGEPSVRSGVWDHSTFKKDALMRLRRTGAAAMMTVYGPKSAAETMIARVVKVHEHVRGETPDGTLYHANDERLLNWVQATASFGFIEGYSRFVAPLSDAQKSQAFAEGAQAARLYGALGAPRSLPEWNVIFESMVPNLQQSEILFEFLKIMRETAIVPAPMRPLQHLLVRAAVDLVPPKVRHNLGLAEAGLNYPQNALVRVLGKLADTMPLRNAPPAQASVRMGLGAGYLYR